MYLLAVEGELFFQAQKNTYGKELWKYGYCSGYSLAGTAGGAAVSLTKPMNCEPLSFYQDKTCNLIARVRPSGTNYVNGNVVSKVKIDASVQTYIGQPYVQRHYDIIPALNASTATSTVTLYFTQAEFDTYNSNNGLYPDLPVNSGDALGKYHLRITQYHGTHTTTPSSPGNYTGNAGAGVVINPGAANVVWNGSYWAVTFGLTGFSGFYAHTRVFPLPITLNYLNGIKQDGKHLLTWKVTCNTTPSATLTLERSADARIFTDIYSITVTALRCQQPFDYTDVQP